MIDIHTHILPGIDDGATNFYEALDMLRIAKENGTKKIVLSPHFYNPRIGYTDRQKVLKAFEELKNSATDLGIEILLAGEIFCSELFLREIEKKDFFTVNNTDYLLIEFDFNDDIDKMLFSLDIIKDAGYKPIIAHPERYRILRKDEYFVQKILSRGGIFQVNSSSLSGVHGDSAARFLNWLLSQGYVSIIASDAHDTAYRSPNLKKAFMWTYSNFPKDYAESLFFTNPEAIISGKDIITRW